MQKFPLSFSPKETLYPVLGSGISVLLYAILWRLTGDLGSILAQVPLFITTLTFIGSPLILSIYYLGASLLITLDLGFAQGSTYLLFVALPSLIFPWLILRSQKNQGKTYWYPLKRLIRDLLLYTSTLTLIFSSLWTLGGWGDSVYRQLDEVWTAFPQETKETFMVFQSYITFIWPYVPGIMIGFFILMTTLSTALTQRWFQKQHKAFPRPPLKLTELYLPWATWKAFVGLGILWAILSYVNPSLAQINGNVALCLLCAFLLQGLSILHAFAKKQKNSHMFLVISYVCMLVFGWPLFIFTIMGILEPWIKLRDRISDNKE